MTRTRITTITIAALTLAAACGGSGGGRPTTTPTPNLRTAYYDDLGAIFQRSQQQSAARAASRTPAAEATPAPDTGAPAIVNDVDALQDLATSLEALTPTDAAKDAHTRLLDATRELIAIEKQEQPTTTIATPADPATAEAEAAPARKRFIDACADLTKAGDDADAPVDLGCDRQ